MNKLEQTKLKLAEVEQEIIDFKAELAKTSVESIKKMMEENILKKETEKAGYLYDMEVIAEEQRFTNKDWTEDKKNYPLISQAIQDMDRISDGIKFSTDLFRYTTKLAKRGELKNMLLYGQTGTGKTTFFRVLGKEINRPVISINASNGMKEEDVFGSYVLDKNTGKPTFVLGPLIIAMLTGAIFVIEEINGAKPSVLLKLNSVMDDLGQVYIKEVGKVFTAVKGFMLGGTFNPGYSGTRKLNKALVNRFQVVAHIQEMNEPQLKSALKHKIPNVTDNELEVSWFVFQGIINALKVDELDGAISLRQMISMINYYRAYNDEYTAENPGKNKSWKQAIRFAVSGQVSGGDDDIERKVMLVAKALHDNTNKSTGLINKGYVVPGESMDILSELKGKEGE